MDGVMLTDKRIAAAFNEWMRRYIDEPERFDRELTTARNFLAESARGKEPSYGDGCAGYLRKLVAEL